MIKFDDSYNGNESLELLFRLNYDRNLASKLSSSISYDYNDKIFSYFHNIDGKIISLLYTIPVPENHNRITITIYEDKDENGKTQFLLNFNSRYDDKDYDFSTYAKITSMNTSLIIDELRKAINNMYKEFNLL